MTGPSNFETWLPVVEDDRYLVSDHGNVFSLRSNRMLVLSPDTHGRLKVDLGKGKTRLVHRLELEAFVGPCPDGQKGLHWNDVCTDNRLANLRWGTDSDNKYDSVRNGRHGNARKTHCKRGHEYTPENTYLTKPGTRRCLACDRIFRSRKRKVAA